MTPRARLATQLLSYLVEIPEEQWITGSYRDSFTDRCCAMGHLGYLGLRGNGASLQMRDLVPNVVRINDGEALGYHHGHPKERIVNALVDIIEEEARK